MARRTPEEVLAQREAWLARKAARESGQDLPIQPPLRPGEVAETPAEPEVSAAAERVVEVAQADEPQVAQPEPEPAQPSPEPEVAQPAAAEEPAAAIKPVTPKRKRTPEEIKAQREAFMAARAAKAAGAAAKTPAPAPAPTAAKAAPAPAAAKPAPKPKAAARPARKKAAPAPEPIDPNITRRELLNYAWLASMALFTVETVGLTLWFAFPNFLEGQFGGIFRYEQAGEVIPEVNAGPLPFNEGKFWLVNVKGEVDGEPAEGVMALFKICTHLGCLYDWVEVTSRFECPCHGSKFELTGDYIAGPARRNLDRFVIQAVSPDGSVRESADGRPLVINDDDMLVVDTGAKIFGSSDIIPA